MILDRRRIIAGAASLSLLAERPWTTQAHSAEATPVKTVGEFSLDARPDRMRLRDGPETDVLRFAGPDALRILRVAKGQAFTVQIHNGLDETTSLQWDGIRGRNGLDDPMTHAADSIPAGGQRDFTSMAPDSGTYWFHPHPGPSDQTGRGLAGVLIVEEPEPPIVDHDIICFLADWPLDPQNRILTPSDRPVVPSAVAFTVGGHPIPSALACPPGARLRLRLINGSTRRLMVIACEGARPTIIAIDGQPSDLFEPIRDTVPIGPGARFDYLVDLPIKVGEAIRLVLKGTEIVDGAVEPDRLISTITTAGEPLQARPPVVALPSNPVLPPKIPLEQSKRADLVFNRTGDGGSIWTVNGISGVKLPNLPVLRVRQGQSVTLGLDNKSDAMVPLRVRGQVMRLLHAKDDGWEPYWRDSVLLPPRSRHHVAFTADTAGRWLIESAFNDQNFAGLRCWFEVS